MTDPFLMLNCKSLFESPVQVSILQSRSENSRQAGGSQSHRKENAYLKPFKMCSATVSIHISIYGFSYCIELFTCQCFTEFLISSYIVRGNANGFFYKMCYERRSLHRSKSTCMFKIYHCGSIARSNADHWYRKGRSPFSEKLRPRVYWIAGDKKTCGSLLFTKV